MGTVPSTLDAPFLLVWANHILPPSTKTQNPDLVSQINIWPPETAVQVLSLGPLSQL